MRFFVTLSLSLISTLSLAQLRSQPKLSFVTQFEFAKAAELQILAKVSDQLKSGDRTVCGHNRALSTAACAATLIRTYRVHSSQGLRAFFDLAVAAAVVDRSRGLDEMQVNRELADNFLAIAEIAAPSKFFAQKMRARSKRDHLERTQARISENASLASFQSQVLPLIRVQIAKVDSAALRRRADKLQQRRWALR